MQNKVRRTLLDKSKLKKIAMSFLASPVGLFSFQQSGIKQKGGSLRPCYLARGKNLSADHAEHRIRLTTCGKHVLLREVSR